nr:hypothetical protein [Tanacetum cinerariifolium]
KSIFVTRTQTKTIIDSLQKKLHDTIYENAKLRAQLFDKVSEQKDTTHETSTNTKFAKQSILGKPPSSSRSKLYAVTPLPKSMAFSKVGIFRMNPFKASRVDNFMPNKHVKESVRTKLITVSQPHVITRNDVNSKTNGFSPKDVKSTTRLTKDLIILRIVPRLWYSVPSSAFNVFRRETIRFGIYIVPSDDMRVNYCFGLSSCHKDRLKQVLVCGLKVPRELVYFPVVSYRDHLDNSSKGYSSGGVMDLTDDEDPTDEDKDTIVGDSEVLVSLVGRAIIVSSKGIGNSLSVVSYAGMTSIYRLSCNGEKAGEAKRSLVKLSKKLREVFPGKAGK